MSSSSPTPHSLRLGFRQTLIRRSSPPLPPAISSAAAFGPRSLVKPHGLKFGFRRSILPIAATDENFMGIPTLLDESISYGISDGEDMKEADRTYPSEDIDLPTCKDGLKISKPQKFASSRRGGWRRRRIGPGVMINIALIVFLVTFLVIFDWHSWRIIRLPLGPFYLTHPFLISAVLSACAGWLYVPIVDSMNIHQILRKEGPAKHYIKKGTPTMGGLFFIPVGIVVARGIVGQSSIQLYGAAVTTLAFAAIGLLDDLLSCMKGHNYGLPGWTKLFLQVAVGTWFSFWLDSATMTTPYNMYSLS